MIRALIVDDEALARTGIKVRLADSDVEVIGEARDGPEAVRLIRELKPDLVFLDVELPEFDGFEVLDRAASDHLPLVVFVTAFSHYAVRAFDAHALDYVLKPISDTRFQQTMRRVHQLSSDDSGRERAHSRLVDGLTDLHRMGSPAAADAARQVVRRFVVKDRSRYRLIKAEDVQWFASASNYVELHAAGRVHLIRMTMNDLEERLDQAKFTRIHRSTIVNIDQIREVVAHPQGDYDVILNDGTPLRMGRGYRDRLLGTASGLT